MAVAAGPDGAIWFAENKRDQIGRITSSGTVTEYSNGITSGSAPYGIVAGPDGALWFTEPTGNRIGRITPGGSVTEYSTGITPGSQPLGITVGPDGALWFTEYLGNRVGRITTAGVVTEYGSGITASCRPHEIVTGPDGALWFAETVGNKIGRITTAGVVTEYATGITPGAGLYGLVVGSDDAIWFTEFYKDHVGRVEGPWMPSSRWIPAVIHKDVPSKNAKWRSDVAVLNRSTSTANLTITMYPAAGPVSRTTQLAGSSQLLQTDIAGWLGVTTDSGPLEVTSDQDFFLSGRTYNQVDATHTYGQDYDGPKPSELLAAGDSAFSTAWLPQLTENALYRTNVGITNTGTTTANVTVTLFDASGNQVWTDSRDYAAGGFYQYQQPYLALGGIASGYAKVTVNSGSGVVAYASVTDNNTGDPTTITMKR
jgi:streptogramin lyase